jgi:RND family efflux transporter MFP subunit
VYVNVGEMVSTGMPVYTIVQIDTIRIDVNVSASDVGRLSEKMPAEVRIAALPDAQFSGWVSAVGVKADEVTRTYPVEVTVENHDHRLMPGMLADVKIITGRENDAIAIPLDAVLERKGSSVVFVEQNGRAIERKVEISSEHGAEAVVSSGLTPGEKLIVIGQHSLEDGRKVTVTD